MKKYFASIFTITLLLFSLTGQAQEAGDDAISPADLAARIAADNAPLVLDVRTEKEFTAGHIPGAINIPHLELQARIDELAGHENDTIVLHCRSGRRAIPAGEVLRRSGFTRVIELDGHMLGWEAGGHPTE